MKTISDDEALALLESIDPENEPGRDGAPIRELSAAVDARDAAQHRVDELVSNARQAGATWVEIAAALKVSPQGARQRYR